MSNQAIIIMKLLIYLLILTVLLISSAVAEDTVSKTTSDKILSQSELSPEIKQLQQKGKKFINEWIPFFGEKKPPRSVSKVYQAVTLGDLTALKIALKTPQGINDLNPKSGISPLHLAVINQRKDLVIILLDHHADVHIRDAVTDDMPLHIAARLSNQFISRLLLNKGANVDEVTHIGSRGDPTRMNDTALHEASRNGDEATARLLVEYKANVKLGNRRQLTPLHLAAAAGNVNICVLLLDQGAIIDHPDRIGATPLHWAVKNGRDDVAQLLLDRGAQVDVKSRSGTTPLFSAVAKRYHSITQKLIKSGADANTPGRNGETPLQRAKKQNNQELLEILQSDTNLPNITNSKE